MANLIGSQLVQLLFFFATKIIFIMNSLKSIFGVFAFPEKYMKTEGETLLK